MRILLVLALILPVVPRVEASGLLKPGDSFPAWSLRDQTGVKVSSADLAGKTYLLWFFPKAMTPGCTAEGRGLRDEFADFRARGVEIVGVSFDDPVTNAAFVKTEGFPFRLLSDESHKLAVSAGAADSADAPVARRVSYLVAPDGKIRRVYGSVNPTSHAKDVLGDLAHP